MLIIFLDGESKSGKTAVGRSIFDMLHAEGYRTRLLVAGNFFRQLTLLMLASHRGLDMTTEAELETAAAVCLDADSLTRPAADLAALEAPDVEGLVSRVGQLSSVQAAATDWRLRSVGRALSDGVEVLLFDGRNLRSKLTAWLERADVEVALELIIYCRPEVAAMRYVRDSGGGHVEAAALAQATGMVERRRQNDRDRSQAAYSEPHDPIQLIVGTHTVDAALTAAWAQDIPSPPRPIRFDNSDVPRGDGLRTVRELAAKSIRHITIK